MFLMARIAVLALVATSYLPCIFAKPYPSPTPTSTSLLTQAQLEKRDTCTDGGGTSCGYYGQICCPSGQGCSTNANNEAICVTQTTAAAANPTCTGVRSPCGAICCESGYYCLNDSPGTCQQLGGGSSGGIIGTLSPSAPLRPTSSTLIIVTATGTPTATVPFETPISTGVTGVPVETSGGGGGLSSGAIAGIVIGVLLGLFLLFLLCLFCCFRALFDTLLACFGGGKRKHTHEETTYIEEHHSSGGGGTASGGGRRWYGQGPARPARAKKSGGGFGNALGIGALLGGAALALGMKRKHDRKSDEKSTTISGSSAYYSDEYTSTSSASSDDRHTRHTRQSSRPGR